MSATPSPLGPSSPSNPEAVLLHISDLHFSDDLFSSRRSWLRRKLGIAPHDFNLIVQLSIITNSLRRQHGDRLLVIATGDLTTSAQPQAFTLVNNYLLNELYTRPTERIGLNSGQNLLVVPGNHDKWFDLPIVAYNRSERYTDSFYSGWIPRFPSAVIRRIGSLDFVFFLVNSNQVRSR